MAMLIIFCLDGGQEQEQPPFFEDKQFKRRIAILQKLQDKYQKLGPEEQEKVRDRVKRKVFFSPNMKIPKFFPKTVLCRENSLSGDHFLYGFANLLRFLGASMLRCSSVNLKG
jgi:hypothetical protein